MTEVESARPRAFNDVLSAGSRAAAFDEALAAWVEEKFVRAVTVSPLTAADITVFLQSCRDCGAAALDYADGLASYVYGVLGERPGSWKWHNAAARELD